MVKPFDGGCQAVGNGQEEKPALTEAVWVPDLQTRDDREAVRARLDVAEKATAVKAQIQMLLRRSGLEKPEGLGSNWAQDRKGHLTRQGSARLRKVLCQATWSRIRHDARTRLLYERLVRRNPKKKKVAVVACMRQLAILMWHQATAECGTEGGTDRQWPVVSG
jgi:transposase